MAGAARDRKCGPGPRLSPGNEQQEASRRFLQHPRLRTHAEQVADRVGQFRPVERVEMEMTHPARIQLAAEFGGDRRGDQLTRGGQFVDKLNKLKI